MLGRVGSHAGALRIVSVMMGVFLVCMGLTKIDWLTDGGILTQMLQRLKKEKVELRSHLLLPMLVLTKLSQR